MCNYVNLIKEIPLWPIFFSFTIVMKSHPIYPTFIVLAFSLHFAHMFVHVGATLVYPSFNPIHLALVERYHE